MASARKNLFVSAVRFNKEAANSSASQSKTLACVMKNSPAAEHAARETCERRFLTCLDMAMVNK